MSALERIEAAIADIRKAINMENGRLPPPIEFLEHTLGELSTALREPGDAAMSRIASLHDVCTKIAEMVGVAKQAIGGAPVEHVEPKPTDETGKVEEAVPPNADGASTNLSDVLGKRFDDLIAKFDELAELFKAKQAKPEDEEDEEGMKGKAKKQDEEEEDEEGMKGKAKKQDDEPAPDPEPTEKSEGVLWPRDLAPRHPSTRADVSKGTDKDPPWGRDPWADTPA